MLDECNELDDQRKRYKKYVEENLRQIIYKAQLDFQEKQNHRTKVEWHSREVFLLEKLEDLSGEVESLKEDIKATKAKGLDEKTYSDLTQKIQDIRGSYCVRARHWKRERECVSVCVSVYASKRSAFNRTQCKHGIFDTALVG